MAITNNGTVVNLPDYQIPSGYSKPTVTTFDDAEYKYKTQISVDKSTVENSDKSTTLTNIIGNGTVGINKQITDMVTADFIGTNTVEIYSVLTRLESNITNNVDSEFYTDTAVAYVATVEYFIKTS